MFTSSPWLRCKTSYIHVFSLIARVDQILDLGVVIDFSITSSVEVSKTGFKAHPWLAMLNRTFNSLTPNHSYQPIQQLCAGLVTSPLLGYQKTRETAESGYPIRPSLREPHLDETHLDCFKLFSLERWWFHVHKLINQLLNTLDQSIFMDIIQARTNIRASTISVRSECTARRYGGCNNIDSFWSEVECPGPKLFPTLIHLWGIFQLLSSHPVPGCSSWN